ncbi:MAG: TonB-dependent receptor, partial [Pseudomonadales bacterium]|nr:TonB-dependent receptor [Pseudomonadales bacterium]
RGEEARRMAFLIDGQEFLDHREVGVPLLVSPATIERIEVIRGPASVLYGPKAMGGVINIITRNETTEPLSASVSTEFNGATEGRQYSAGLSGYRAGWQWQLAATRNDQNDRETPDGKVDNTSYENDSISVSVQKTLANQKFMIGYEDFNADAEVFVEPEVRFTPPFLDFAIDTPQRDRNKLRAGYEYSFDGERLRTVKPDAYRQVSDRQFNTFMEMGLGPGVIMDISILTDSQLVSTGLNGQLDFSVGDHWLIAGIQTVRDEVDQTRQRQSAINGFASAPTDNFDEARLDSNALYLQDDWQLTDKLSALLGARYYHVDGELEDSNRSDRRPEFDDTHMVASAALVYSPGQDLTLRANVTQGYIFPSLLNLAVGAYAGSRFVNPDPDLKPETSDNAELGLRYSGHDWLVDAALFWSSADNYIDHVFCTPDDNCLTSRDKLYKNVGEANSHGVEVSTRYSLEMAEIYANLTWMKRRKDEQGVDTYNSGVPEWSGRVGIERESVLFGQRLSVDVYSRFESSSEETVLTSHGLDTETNDGWATWNADVNLYWNDRFQITGSLRNITDKKYSSATENLLAPGRHLQLGFRASL